MTGKRNEVQEMIESDRNEFLSQVKIVCKNIYQNLITYEIMIGIVIYT